MKLLILIAVVTESAASFTDHLGLFGRSFTHHNGLFGRNHTHLLELVSQKITHKLDRFGHELIGSEVADKHRLPGWVPNILNPLVRAAFPKANAYYLAHYASNVTFDGPGKNRSHPLDPSYKIPTIKPPAKRWVPPFNPAVYNETLAQSQQEPGPLGTAQNASANNVSLTTNLQSRAYPAELVFQASPKSNLTSGQQLQQVLLRTPTI